MAGILDPSYIDAIKGFEGYAPKASWDYKQNSNGYGTKAQYPGEVIDQDTANQRFNGELASAASAVDRFIPGAPPGVRAALTSLTYNAGPVWMNSGLGAAVKSGDWDSAQKIFLQYNKAGGQVNPGLVNRRTAEAGWFNQPPVGDAPQQVAQSQPQQQASLPPQQQTAPISSPAPIGGVFQPQPIPQQISQPQFAQAPPLNAPHDILRQYIARKAFSQIPTPTGFRGFSYS